MGDATPAAPVDLGAAFPAQPEAQSMGLGKPPKVSSPEEAAKIAPGSSFIGPDDKEHVVPFKISHPTELADVPDGADFVGPDGKLRQKPKYEGVGFSAQTLYDIAHSDKGRKMALEKFYPGKVKDDPSGGFYVEDEGKFYKPGRGASKYGGAIASEAIPTVLAGAGGLLGGAAGTALASPGAGTVLGGAAGGYGGGYAGQRINDIFSQLAGVYDPEGGEANARMAGYMGAAGDVGGRAVAAAAPAIKEGAQLAARGAAKTVNKFLGTDPEALESALNIAQKGEQPGSGPFGLSKAGTEVSPSAIFKSSPHVAPNLAETLAQKFDASKSYKTHAELYMDKEAAEILAHKDIGAIVEGSLVHPKAAVPTEKAGVALQEAARLHAVNQSAEADRQLAEALASRRAGVEGGGELSLPPGYQINSVKTRPAGLDPNAASGFKVDVVDGNGKVQFRARLDPFGDSYHIGDIERVGDEGKGLGPQVYSQLAKFVENNTGKELKSGLLAGDTSPGARKTQQKLQQMGLFNPETRKVSSKTPNRLEEARGRKANVERAAEEAKTAADNLVQQGFRHIEQQANDAIRVAQVGHNAGDLWRTVAESFVNLRRSIGARASQMYRDSRAASNGLVPPGAEGLAPRAQALLDQLPEGFAGSHPTIVRRIAAMAGDEEAGRAPVAAAWDELHELRTMIRQDIKWNDLTSDVKNGALKHMQNGIDEVLHSVENQPELREASRLLRLADDFYRENMGPLNDAQIKSLVKALDSGLQADPKALLKVAIKDGKTEVANTIRNTVGPQTWDAMRAADVQDMLASSRQLDGSIDGAQFAKQVLDRQRNGVLGTLHGEAGAARLNQQATYIEQLRGKLPIQARPGDTANDIIVRARSAVADAENLAKADPLKALQNDMKKVEAAVRKEGEANRTRLQNTDPTGQQNQALALLNNSTVGANKAVDRILADPDLIVAASRAFPGGEKSSAFQLMRQIWTQRFLSETLEPGEKLAATSPEIQALMFPGVTLDDMHMLAKEMKLLMSGATTRPGGSEMGGSIMAVSAVENPFGRASGLGKLAGPMKILPGANFGARAALTAYYNGIRGLMTSPSTLRWLRKGLMSRDPQAKEVARAELQAALQRGGAMGASGAEAVYQGSGQ